MEEINLAQADYRNGQHFAINGEITNRMELRRIDKINKDGSYETIFECGIDVYEVWKGHYIITTNLGVCGHDFENFISNYAKYKLYREQYERYPDVMGYGWVICDDPAYDDEGHEIPSKRVYSKNLLRYSIPTDRDGVKVMLGLTTIPVKRVVVDKWWDILDHSDDFMGSLDKCTFVGCTPDGETIESYRWTVERIEKPYYWNDAYKAGDVQGYGPHTFISPDSKHYICQCGGKFFIVTDAR
jgi:hypothetical protein